MQISKYNLILNALLLNVLTQLQMSNYRPIDLSIYIPLIQMSKNI